MLENKEYSLADTYPRYLVLPALMTKDEIRVAAGMHIIADQMQYLYDVSIGRSVGALAFLCIVHRPDVVWLLFYSDFSFCSPFLKCNSTFIPHRFPQQGASAGGDLPARTHGCSADPLCAADGRPGAEELCGRREVVELVSLQGQSPRGQVSWLLFVVLICIPW